MTWTCPACRTAFIVENESHECSGDGQYRIGGEIPNGAPGKDHDPALSSPLPLQDAIRHSFDLVLSATGIRDGFESSIDPVLLHKAIRVYRPKNKFEHLGKPCHITDLDERVHAGRIAHRLVNQALAERVKLPGGWNSTVATKARLDALYALIRGLAAKNTLHPLSGEPIDR